MFKFFIAIVTATCFAKIHTNDVEETIIKEVIEYNVTSVQQTTDFNALVDKILDMINNEDVVVPLPNSKNLGLDLNSAVFIKKGLFVRTCDASSSIDEETGNTVVSVCFNIRKSWIEYTMGVGILILKINKRIKLVIDNAVIRVVATVPSKNSGHIVINQASLEGLGHLDFDAGGILNIFNGVSNKIWNLNARKVLANLVRTQFPAIANGFLEDFVIPK